MTEREKWEAGLWYDANYTPELCAEREKAEELYTEFNQTRPSEKAKRAELLRQLLPHMEENRRTTPRLHRILIVLHDKSIFVSIRVFNHMFCTLPGLFSIKFYALII